MVNRTITKTVHQYSAAPVPPDIMEKLQAVADGYRAVKDYVYQRYGGIRSMGKLYPVYTVQNEMTKTGLRKALGLSVASFYPAIFEALVDIRNQWDKEKSIVGKRIRENESFSDADRHYLRFVLSIDQIFIAVLNRQPFEVSEKLRNRFEELSQSVNTLRLENYLRRQIRKIHARPKTDAADSFVATIDGYRYGDHGIYLATTERRKRVFVPLTDNNRYTRQIEVKLYPARNSIELLVPIEVRIKEHEDYRAELGVAMGMRVMLTTHEGHTYGEDIESYHQNLSLWLRKEHDKYQRNHLANPGRKKYEAEKRRREEHLHSYINKEINRFLREEKPRVVCIMKFPQGNRRYGEKSVSYSVRSRQRGYIRKQLMLKCKENAIELVEVFGKDIGIECSRCGGTGNRKDGIFTCACGHSVPEKQNVAQNAKKRGAILVAEKAFPYGGNTVAGVRWTPRAGDRVSGG